jgi:hypothetical protein
LGAGTKDGAKKEGGVRLTFHQKAKAKVEALNQAKAKADTLKLKASEASIHVLRHRQWKERRQRMDELVRRRAHMDLVQQEQRPISVLVGILDHRNHAKQATEENELDVQQLQVQLTEEGPEVQPKQQQELELLLDELQPPAEHERQEQQIPDKEIRNPHIILPAPHQRMTVSVLRKNGKTEQRRSKHTHKSLGPENIWGINIGSGGTSINIGPLMTQNRLQAIHQALADFYATRALPREGHLDLVMEEYRGREHEILEVIRKAENEAWKKRTLRQKAKSSTQTVGGGGKKNTNHSFRRVGGFQFGAEAGMIQSLPLPMRGDCSARLEKDAPALAIHEHDLQPRTVKGGVWLDSDKSLGMAVASPGSGGVFHPTVRLRPQVPRPPKSLSHRGRGPSTAGHRKMRTMTPHSMVAVSPLEDADLEAAATGLLPKTAGGRTKQPQRATAPNWWARPPSTI